MAQWVKASAFGSGYDPRVLGSSPASGSLLSQEPASPSLCLCLPLCLLVISVCQSLVRHKAIKSSSGGAWVAQWVKASAFGSGCDPRVLGSSPASGSLLGREPASLSLSACLAAYL